MASPEALPQLLTIDQLAERLGVSIRHLRRLVAERRVPYLKVGWLVRFDPAEITAWLDGARHPQRSTTGDGLIWPSVPRDRRQASGRFGASPRDHPVSALRSERGPNIRERISASTHRVAPDWRYSEGHAKCPDQVRS